MSTPNPLGTTPIDTFLSDYWQVKPLLVRGGMSEIELPFDADELAGLSLNDEVEARIIECEDPTDPQSAFRLQHGPFNEATFQALPEQNWTLLVQAVELWVPELKSLLEHFHFLPPWRLDDIMASFAVPGGGVGPHFDLYDVFLIQAAGKRRWRVGQTCNVDSPLIQHEAIATLSKFETTAEWVLEPGDVLYVPPSVAHWGIAETTGITLSVGFRSPSLNELLDDLTVEVMAAGATQHLKDPPLTQAMATAQIHPAYLAQIQALLRTLLDDEQRLGEWLARYMTRPKYPDLVDLTDENRRAEFSGVTYINGEPID